ncbi:MAG: GNAT family N-acetyltransferase [Thermodesulfobacteriota bacterium]
MNKTVNYRSMAKGEEIEVCNLVARSFNEFIGPEFSEQGIEEFFGYANTREFKKRLKSDYLAMIAEIDGSIAGVIEIKGNSHISMLYVDKSHHRKGIAKSLVKNALSTLTADEITVNSSRYAVAFYESLGFIQFENEKTIYGVIHVPMVVSTSKLNEMLT